MPRFKKIDWPIKTITFITGSVICWNHSKMVCTCGSFWMDSRHHRVHCGWNHSVLLLWPLYLPLLQVPALPVLSLSKSSFFGIHIGPNEIFDFCFWNQIKMTQKEVIWIVKWNRTNQNKKSRHDLPKNIKYCIIMMNQNDSIISLGLEKSNK